MSKSKPSMKSKVKTGTTNATATPLSQKQAAKARREAQQKRQQQQTTILVTVSAVVLLAIVILFVVIQNQPVEATIPDGVTTTYADLRNKGWMGRGEDKNFFLGSPTAPATIVEYGSFSCIACYQYHGNYYRGLQDKIKSGDLKFVYKPITTTGEFEPTPMTKAAYCAGLQDRFWEFHDILFDWQVTIASSGNDTRRLASAASKLGLNMNDYNNCMASGDPQNFINTVAADATAKGVNSTPTVYIYDGPNELKVYPETTGQPNAASLLEVRGLIEAYAAKAKAAQPTAPAPTQAPTSAPTQAATPAATAAK